MDEDEDQRKILELTVEQQLQHDSSRVLRALLAMAIRENVHGAGKFITSLKRLSGEVPIEPSADVAKKYGDKLAGMWGSSVQQRLDRELLLMIKLLESMGQ